MSRRRSTSSRYLGTFGLGSEGETVGQLSLHGPATSLNLHANSPIGMSDRHSTIHGRAYTGEHLTLVDCLRTSMTSGGAPDAPRRYSATIGPTFVVVGAQHFDPDAPCIRSILFSTTDLHTVFYDFHAFGMIFDSKGNLDRMLKELKEDRAKEVGEEPIIGYFTGRFSVAEVQTALGKVSVNHAIHHNFGGASGVVMKNRMVVAIEPETPMTFDAAITAMADVALFLSIAAGRGQGISRIHVVLAGQDEKPSAGLRVHMSFPWKTSSNNDRFRPHPADMPLRPIEDPEEFRRVLANWISTQPGARIARHRYLSCLRKGNTFGPDRMITAANMFDLLPAVSVPVDRELSPDLTAARDESVARFRALPDSPERSSALSALGRLGSPFLVKKVLHRVAMIDPILGDRFPELGWVATIAVKCRNVFVHGTSKDFDIEKVEPFVPFLTEVLEFIFGASDLIESGWSGAHWLDGGSVGRHNFARLRVNYQLQLTELKQVLRPGH